MVVVTPPVRLSKVVWLAATLIGHDTSDQRVSSTELPPSPHTTPFVTSRHSTHNYILRRGETVEIRLRTTPCDTPSRPSSASRLNPIDSPVTLKSYTAHDHLHASIIAMPQNLRHPREMCPGIVLALKLTRSFGYLVKRKSEAMAITTRSRCGERNRFAQILKRNRSQQQTCGNHSCIFRSHEKG